MKMRLINVLSMKLEEFVAEDDIPRYAILSHTWEKEEVSFQDFQSPTRTRLYGWQKLKNFCRLVSTNHKLLYAWADTCCIDKSSSTELSEAINSMFRWYRHSRVCIVYLSDVFSNLLSAHGAEWHFNRSRWFRRGWTLQELLAPENVWFYEAAWSPIGSARELEIPLSSVTGIPPMYLFNGTARAASIAMRMSWAAKRATTRSEDIAYCLPGLFQVNMPLLYGEGGREAFIRLQSELIRNSDDESIFAWARWGEKTGMLANSPADFEDSYDVYAPQYYNDARDISESYELTNRGLKLSLKLYLCPSVYVHELYILPLNCYTARAPSSQNTKITLLLIRDSHDENRKTHFFRRIGPMAAMSKTAVSEMAFSTSTHTSQLGSPEPKSILVRNLDPQDFLNFHKGSVSVYEDTHTEEDSCSSQLPDRSWWELLEPLNGNTQFDYLKILSDLVRQPKLKIEFRIEITLPWVLANRNVPRWGYRPFLNKS